METVTMAIYTDDEIRQSVKILTGMYAACERGDIDQHASPAILMSIDALTAVLGRRKLPLDTALPAVL